MGYVMVDYSKLTDKRHIRGGGQAEVVVRLKNELKIPVYRVSLDCVKEMNKPNKKWVKSNNPKSWSGSLEMSIAYLVQYYIGYLVDTDKFTTDFVLDQIQLVCDFYGIDAHSVFEKFHKSVGPRVNTLKRLETLAKHHSHHMEAWEISDIYREIETLQSELEDPKFAESLYSFFLSEYRDLVNDDRVNSFDNKAGMLYGSKSVSTQVSDIQRHHETHCMYTGLLSNVAISIGCVAGRPQKDFIDLLPTYEAVGLIDILTAEEVSTLQNRNLVPYNHYDDEEFEIWDKSHLDNLKILYTSLDVPSIVPSLWGGLPIEIFVPPMDFSEPLELEKILKREFEALGRK